MSRASDLPERAGLRRLDLPAAHKALRAAVVVPAVFAIAREAVGDLQVALFASFGAFSLLLMVEVTGEIRNRAIVYSCLVATGSVLVSLGTLCSRSAWLAALAMLLVGFVVLGSGGVSGYAAASSPAAILTFVLAACVPADPGAIPARLAGWWLAAAVAVPAALFVWPLPRRTHLRRAVGDACVALGELARARSAGGLAQLGRLSQLALEKTRQARDAFQGLPYRPTGPTRSNQALARLVDELEWIASFLTSDDRGPSAAGAGGRSNEGDALAAIQTVLDESAAVVRRKGSPGQAAASLARLDRARVALARDSLTAFVGAPPSDRSSTALSARDPSFRLRAACFAAHAIGVSSLQSVTDRPVQDPPVEIFSPSAGDSGQVLVGADAAIPAGALVRGRAVDLLTPRAVWFRNSLRGAIALAIAVLVALALDLQHAFWVVLGTLSVLRSSALATEAIAVDAVLGTTIGLVIGGALLVLVGSHSPALWVALVIAVLIAGYAPDAISYTAGQAAFTLVVSILFNLIQPVGWRVGLVRVEDVAIGAAVSLFVGVLFWPRGAASSLGRSAADAYRAAVAHFEAAVGNLLGYNTPQEASERGRAATAASRRVDDAVRIYLSERGAKPVPVAAMTTLLLAFRQMCFVARSIEVMAGRASGRLASARCQHVLDADLQALARWHESLADVVSGQTDAVPAPGAVSAQAFESVLRCIQEAAQPLQGDQTAAVLDLMWVTQQLDYLVSWEAVIAASARELVEARRAHRERSWAQRSRMRVRPRDRTLEASTS